MTFERLRETPDGLDPVVDAYHCLAAIFEAAEPVDHPTGDFMRLPGSGEVVDLGDINPLNGLEFWLGEQIGSLLDGGSKSA